MDSFKEFLTSYVGNSDNIEWWMLLTAIIAVVVVLCVIIGIVWTRMDKKNKKSKTISGGIEQTAAAEPVISVAPSEQSVEPQLPTAENNTSGAADDGIVDLQNSETIKDKDSVLNESAVNDEVDVKSAAAAVMPKNNDNDEMFDNSMTESEADMGLFKKKSKADDAIILDTAVKNDTKTSVAVKIANANDTKTSESVKARKPAAAQPSKAESASEKRSDAPRIKAVPIAKKSSSGDKSKSDEPKKPKVIVGTDALPKSVKKNIKLNEIKNTVTVNSGETFGKYLIVKDDRNTVKPYKFELRANNGQLLFESEPYKVKPRENSIEAFKKHVNTGEFVVDEDKFGFFRYKLYTDAGKLLGVGESYKTRQACVSSIESVKRFSMSATAVEDTTVDNTDND